MKKRFIATLLASALSITMLAGCGTAKEEQTECFDFTAPELVSELDEWLIDLTELDAYTFDDATDKVIAYVSNKDVFTTDADTYYAMMHYDIYCNNETDEVSSLSFFIDRNSADAASRYLYHISSVAQSIDENVNTETIYDTIVTDSEIDGLYSGEHFIIRAYNDENYYHATFIPINKGND